MWARGFVFVVGAAGLVSDQRLDERMELRRNHVEILCQVQDYSRDLLAGNLSALLCFQKNGEDLKNALIPNREVEIIAVRYWFSFKEAVKDLKKRRVDVLFLRWCLGRSMYCRTT